MSYGGRPLEDVEHRGAERPHVGGLVATATGRDLGREVGRRPGDDAGLGEGGIRRDARDAEVGQLHLPGAVDQDVRRLDVAVHDPGGVGGGQGVGGLDQQRARPGRGRAAPRSRTSRPRSAPSTYSITSHQESSRRRRRRRPRPRAGGAVARSAAPHARRGRGRCGRLPGSSPIRLSATGRSSDLVATQPDRPGATATDSRGRASTVLRSRVPSGRGAVGAVHRRFRRQNG